VNTDDLIDTLAREGRKLLDLTTGEDVAAVPERAVRDAAELWRVVARLVKDRTPLEVFAAFGHPGNWGYGTPIGAALKRYYDAASSAAKGGVS
jgi:N6-adenosine-specific RNA methylase IME4